MFIPQLPQWLAGHSIKKRLMLSFMLLVLVPSVIISGAIVYKSTRLIDRNMESSIAYNLDMIVESIVQKLDGMNDLGQSIYLNEEMLRILSSDLPTEKIDFINEAATLNKIISSYQQSQSLDKRYDIELYMLYRPEYALFAFSDHVFSMTSIETEPWYLQLPIKTEYTVLAPFMDKGNDAPSYQIRLVKRLYGLHNIQIPYMALLTIDIPIDEWDQMLESFKPTPNSSVHIINQDQTIALSSEKNLVGSVMTLFEQDGFKTFKKTIPALGLTVVSSSPLQELTGELTSFQRTTFVILVGALLVSLLLAILMSQRISEPIRSLVRSMAQVKEGNFELHITYKRQDEFSYLIRHYREMLKRIKDLIDKLYISEAKKKEAELQALQAQINPHFLYNTLDSINWLAIERNADNISTMVTSLSDFFRYSLNNGKTLITIGDELKQAESYLTIQKVRFGDSFQYDIDAETDSLSCITVKLVLQPLLENAIVHGLARSKEQGWIRICVRKEADAMRILVADNGIGADADELNDLIQERIEPRSYGIHNVHSRIRHTFGEAYGLHYEASNHARGLTAVITLPVKHGLS